MYRDLLPYLEEWFRRFSIRGFEEPFDYAKSQAIDLAHFTEVFDEFSERMEQNYPFHSSFYAGQMLKPPHPVAWLAYTMAMTINPNNHALDGGPPTSKMEKDTVKVLAEMIGFNKTYLGHLTSSGTIANLEALWVARCIHPDKKILYSDSAHYTHNRMCDVLGLKHEVIKSDNFDRLDIEDLKSKIKDAGTIVVTLGTTGRGAIDDLSEIVPLCRENNVRIHIDAAYGGFFKIISDKLPTSQIWSLTAEADSFVIDPHKHGLQPYGCGCIIFKDPKVGSFYKHNSPYTYFSSDELHLGEISLECSRAGASAAALWFTLKLFTTNKTGLLANGLLDCYKTAQKFSSLIESSDDFILVNKPELDIVCYYPIGASLSEISSMSQKIFEQGMKESPENALYISLYTLPAEKLIKNDHIIKTDCESVKILRSVFMKPEQLSDVQEIFRRLSFIKEKSI